MKDILKTLREELEKLEKYIKSASRERETSDTYSIKWYLECLNDVKNILTSLEEKPMGEEWTPTPWEMIEVSNDGYDCDWMNAKFLYKDSAGYYCEYENYWEKEQDYFDNARPIKESPELEIPDFDYDEMYNKGGHPNTQCFVIWKQLEALTKFCQSLSRKK